MRRTGNALLAALAVAGWSALAGLAHAQSRSDTLAEGFAHPPDSAKPRTSWHWTSGNVTKEGITKDLEWMKRVGLSGMQLADVASGGGQTAERKILFGSPEWFEAVRHAAAEADRFGLEMSIFSLAPAGGFGGGPRGGFQPLPESGLLGRITVVSRGDR